MPYGMAKGLFTVGFTVSEILEIQNRAKGLLLEGKTLMSWSDSGSSVSKQFPMTVKETLEECAFALQKLHPEVYGRPRKVSQSFVGRFLVK
jgi:hypothetical protein